MAKYDPHVIYPVERKHEGIMREIRKGHENLRSIDPQHVRPVVDLLQKEARRTGRDHDR
jgi:hypothetical protein